MGLFDDLFKKKGVPEKINFGGKEYQLNPDALVYSQLGIERYQQGDYSGAVAEFTKAIKAHPDNQNFYTMRGTAYEDMSNDLEAARDFRKALELEPNNFVAAYRLGMVFFREKDFENAIKWLKTSFENSSDVDMESLGWGKNNIMFVSKKVIAGNLGNILTQVGLFEEGFKYLDIAIQLDPSYPNPYVAKGVALTQMGKHQEGIRNLQKAVQLGNGQAAMLIQLLSKM